MSIKAMKLALEALENSVDLVVADAYNAEQLYGNYPTRQGKVGGLKILAEAHKKAITALRQAIEQEQKPEGHQEPHGWYIDGYGAVIGSAEPKSVRVGEWLPWYTSPPQRKPLTNEEIQDVMTKAVQAKEVSWLGYKEDEGRRYTIPVLSPYHFQIVRAIEAVHGIKE